MRTLDVKKPILTIPNMAIHINKEVNKGFELNRQVDTIPLMLWGVKISVRIVFS